VRIKKCTLVQYRFYLAEDGLEPLVKDANAYLYKVGCGGTEITEQQLKEALSWLGKAGGRVPIHSVLKLKADHVMIAHSYHETLILHLIANSKSGAGWKRLNETFRCDTSTNGIGDALLFQGSYDRSETPLKDILDKCRKLKCSLGIRDSLLRWCRLDAGFLVQLSDTVFVLASPQGAQEAVDNFALENFPKLMTYFLKARFQEKQYNYLLNLMSDASQEREQNRGTSPVGSSRESEEWERHRGIVPTIQIQTNEAVVFVTENEAAIRIIGSKEARELIRKLRQLRLSYARLAKAVSDADKMRETVFVNIRNYRDCLSKLKVVEDGGFISTIHRVLEITMETLSYQMFSHKAVVERTKAVLEALNKHAQELRDLQSQEEVRLQSIQTSLIAAIASLIGVGQLFASIPAMMQWDADLKSWFLILVGVVTFALSHVAFNFRRRKTLLDYFCSGVASGAMSLTLYLWSSRYSVWATAIQSVVSDGGWTKVCLFASGFIFGLVVTWLIDWLAAWRIRREIAQGE